MRIKISGYAVNLQNKSGIKVFLPFLVFLVLFAGTLTPLLCEAEYRVYLKNGQVINKAEYVLQDDKTVKIIKNGGVLELQRKSVLKVEEYNTYEPLESKTEEEKSPSLKKDIPEYFKNEQREYLRQKQIENTEKARKLIRLKKQLRSVTNKIKYINTLENKHKELQRLARKKWSPRKARIARTEKEAVEKQLEAIGTDKASLIEQKNRLEDQIKRIESQ